MKQFHLGIDFGTSQSKACIYNFDSDEHEFFRFHNSAYFIPSRVVKLSDGTFRYGDNSSPKIHEEYKYFKMQAAEDEEFHFVSFGNANIVENRFYNFNNTSYTPEFLSVVYLTYIQLNIKEVYQGKYQSNSTESGGALARLFKRTASTEQEIKFTTRIGIPTEWSQKNNLKRKRKFESILFISQKLQEKYKTVIEFESIHSNELIKDVKNIYNENKVLSATEFNEELNLYGLSVYPETAAGLMFMVNSRQLENGFYAAMDIGAGTTDVSFFGVNNETIKYLASESYMIASNNVYSKYASNTNSTHNLSETQEKVEELIKNETDDLTLNISAKDVINDLEKQIYYLFNKRVYPFAQHMVQHYKNQPVIIYGGGSNLPGVFSYRLKIHDNGFHNSLTPTELEKIEIERYATNINILPNDGSWMSIFDLLVVALGLSYIKHEQDADWFDESEYQNKDNDRRELIQHPFNEDYYIYNVL